MSGPTSPLNKTPSLKQSPFPSLNNLDDSRAREEWGWEPLYSDFDKIVGDFIKEVRTKPAYYSLAFTDAEGEKTPEG